jgi:hypothetical protein
MSPASALIPLNDLGRHSAGLASELNEALTRVAASGWYVMGNEVTAFERGIRDLVRCFRMRWCGQRYGRTGDRDAERRVEAGSRVVTVANAGGYSSIAMACVGGCSRLC